MTPIQSKRIAKVVQVLASLKTASADWDIIVDAATTALVADSYAMAVEDSLEGADREFYEGDAKFSRTPWGGGDDVMDFAPDVDDNIRSQVAAILEKEIGKDAILADCDAFIEKTGENADTYGHYLMMQSMGHGVGLFDYDYDSAFDIDRSSFAHVHGYITVSGDEDDTTLTYNLDGDGITWDADVTSELTSSLVE